MKVWKLVSTVAALIISTSANAALIERLGGLAYYDTDLNITWTANANINGLMTWDEANTWASSLEIAGVQGWRLPNMNLNGGGIAVNCFGGGREGCEANELGYLFWEEGITSDTQGPFTNVVDGWMSYWSSTQLDPMYLPDGSADHYETMEFTEGLTGAMDVDSQAFAWAVHTGDVSAVPVPAAIWLFGSGLLGLVGIARRKKA